MTPLPSPALPVSPLFNRWPFSCYRHYTQGNKSENVYVQSVWCTLFMLDELMIFRAEHFVLGNHLGGELLFTLAVVSYCSSLVSHPMGFPPC